MLGNSNRGREIFLTVEGWVVMLHSQLSILKMEEKCLVCLGKGKGVMCSAWSFREKHVVTQVGRMDWNACGLEDEN